MPLPEDLSTKIKNKKLGISSISPDSEFSGEDGRDRPYKFATEILTINEEILKLMELYDIQLLDAITVGVKAIAISNLDEALSNTLEEEEEEED